MKPYISLSDEHPVAPCRPWSVPCRSPRRLNVAQRRPRGGFMRPLCGTDVGSVWFIGRSTHTSGVAKASSKISGGKGQGLPSVVLSSFPSSPDASIMPLGQKKGRPTGTLCPRECYNILPSPGWVNHVHGAISRRGVNHIQKNGALLNTKEL